MAQVFEEPKRAYWQAGVQWSEDMNQNFIIPELSGLQYDLESRGWEVTYQKHDHFRIATYALNHREGHGSHPEKPQEDWDWAVSRRSGLKNLGPINGPVEPLLDQYRD